MTQIIYVLGATCSGKSTFVAEAAKFSDEFGIVQVGKELRRRHPPEYFQGKGAMDFTEKEVEEIFTEGVQAAIDANKIAVFVDGNPRSYDQLYLLGKFHEREVFWWLHADELQVRDWLRDRFPEDVASRELAEQRLTNDCVQLMPLLHELVSRRKSIRAIRMAENFDYTRYFQAVLDGTLP